MKNVVLLSLLVILNVVNAATYTITNTSDKSVKVTYRESFKNSEQKTLDPKEFFDVNTQLLNCLDYVRVEALDSEGNIISQHPYEQLGVCAGTGTLCIVNGKSINPVEIYQAWRGISAEACAKDH